MWRDGVALKKMPTSRVLSLPGVTEASALDVSIQELSLYVADAGQGSVDVLQLNGSRSRQELTPSRQILKLRVGINKREMATSLILAKMAFKALNIFCFFVDPCFVEFFFF